MSDSLLTQDQSDMLREIVNIAMGRAGADLAKLLDGFVDLSVPRIVVVRAEELSEEIVSDSVFAEDIRITAFSQSYSNIDGLEGDAFVVVDDTSERLVREIFGVSDTESATDADFLLDLINMLIGACVSGVSNQLFDTDVTYGKPVVVARDRPLREVAFDTFRRRNLTWDYSLMARITFVIRDFEFKSELIIFLTEDAARTVQSAVAELVEDA